MNVLLLQPGYPTEIPFFTRGLEVNGATVYGVGDQPEHDLPKLVRDSIKGYLRVGSLADEKSVVEAVKKWAADKHIDKVESLWEPGILIAAQIREALGVPGMSVKQATWFRNKDVMKQVLSKAGIRVPKHASAKTAADVRKAAKKIGYPIIVKPIAGAGSSDTYRVNDDAELDATLKKMGHIDEVNIEEFIDGEEYTFDTICVDGEIKFWNIFVYRPRPLIARSVEWISPQTVALRDPEADELAAGRKLGQAVLKALKFQTGFTHMEWYMKPDGEVVFGEIAARPPGARSVDAMNYACDIDLFVGWGEAVVKGTFSQKVERKYNSAIVFKRAQGQGRIRKIEGLDQLRRRFGDSIACVDLLPLGAERRNWVQTLTSDGYVVVRHPDLQTCLDMADAVGTDLQMYAS
ncbi:MAG: acetyl-CoA carboxylase biotin carboxylase subunit family protein [Gemmatimonadaceae bacterium]